MAAPLFSFGDNLINWDGLTSFVFKNLFFGMAASPLQRCVQLVIAGHIIKW